MTSEMSIGVRRGARVPTKEELKRHFLALVLAAVLVWYTALVVPAHAKTFAARTHDDEERDGEVRGPGGVASSDSRADSTDTTGVWFAFGPTPAESARESVEDLDWPEYIFVD